MISKGKIGAILLLALSILMILSLAGHASTKVLLAKESRGVQTYQKQASAEELTKHGEETSKESEVKGEEASKESEGEAEGEGGGEGEAEKPWWQFEGWEAVFTVLGCILYAIVLQVLPRFISKGGAQAH